MVATRTRRRVDALSSLVGVLVGAGLGLALSSALYLAITPVLERSDSWLRELQGLSWNLVPALTLAGAVLGWWVARSCRR